MRAKVEGGIVLINRLEEIESILKDYEELKEKRDFKQAETALLYLCENHIDYLIQQAEKSEELQAKVEELEKQYSTRLGKFLKIQEEKKRYKEALEEIRNEASSYMGSPAANRVYDIADNELRGESK